jgi:hypothetical protein
MEHPWEPPASFEQVLLSDPDLGADRAGAGGVGWVDQQRAAPPAGGEASPAGETIFDSYAAPPARDVRAVELYRQVRSALVQAYPPANAVARHEICMIAADYVHLARLRKNMAAHLWAPVNLRNEDRIAARRVDASMRRRADMQQLLARAAGETPSVPPLAPADAARLADQLSARVQLCFNSLEDAKSELEEYEAEARAEALNSRRGGGGKDEGVNVDARANESAAAEATGPDAPGPDAPGPVSAAAGAAGVVLPSGPAAAAAAGPAAEAAVHAHVGGSPRGQGVGEHSTDAVGAAGLAGDARGTPHVRSDSPATSSSGVTGDPHDEDLAGDLEYEELVTVWRVCETMKPVREQFSAAHVTAVLLGTSQLTAAERAAWRAVIEYELENQYLSDEDRRAKGRYEAAVRASLNVPAPLAGYVELRRCCKEIEANINARVARLARRVRPEPRTRVRRADHN